jgi:hypothetical protein
LKLAPSFVALLRRYLGEGGQDDGDDDGES